MTRILTDDLLCHRMGQQSLRLVAPHVVGATLDAWYSTLAPTAAALTTAGTAALEATAQELQFVSMAS